MAANPLRLLFSALAYTLIERLRALALVGTDLARAQAVTIRVRVFLARHHPGRGLFLAAARALAP